MSKIKRIPYIVSTLAATAIAALILLTAQFTTAVGAAQTVSPVDVDLLYPPTGQTQYAYFDRSTAVAANQTELFVTTANGVFVYAYNGKPIEYETPSAFADAKRVCKKGDLWISLEKDESVYKLCARTGNADPIVYTTADDFSVYGNTLYAYANGADGNATVATYGIGADGLTAEGAAVTLPNTVITALAAANGKAYGSVQTNATGKQDDLGTLSNGTFTVGKQYTTPTRRLTYTDGILYAVYSDRIVAYEPIASLFVETVTLGVADVVDLAAGSETLFALTGNGAVLKIDPDLSGYSELLASSSRADGFYNLPYATVTRNDKTVVADYNNSRVTVLTDGGVAYPNYSFVYPTGVAVDDYGRIYVSHYVNRIEVFGENGAHADTLTFDGKEIENIYIDSTDRLYVRFSDAFARIENGQAVTVHSGAVTAAAVTPDKQTVYLAYGGKIYAIANDTEPEIVAAISDTIVDFAVDAENSIYVLDNTGAIRKYEKNGENYVLTKSATAYGGYGITNGACNITLSSIKTTFVDYGDIIVTDTKAHTVKKIDATVFNVKTIDENVTPPVADDDTPNIASDESIVFYAQEDISVYDLPRDMSPSYKITKNSKIIVPIYNLPDTDAYSYVLIPDKAAKTLVGGYVRKQRLPESTRLPYVAPPAELACTWNDNTVVYKYPSIYAKPIAGYDNLHKGTELPLKTFANGFVDDDGFRWYRVSLEDGASEGYVNASNLSIGNYQPIFIRPQYNAVIISAAESQTAVAYSLNDDGTYAETDITLNAGTRVEVVGTFDPSAPYTKIKYFDETLGTLECYVKTEHIKYNGVSVLQIVVFVLLGVVVVLLIVLIVHRVYVVRKRKHTL